MITSKQEVIERVYEKMADIEVINFADYPVDEAKKVITDILKNELKDFVLVAKTSIIE